MFYQLMINNFGNFGAIKFSVSNLDLLRAWESRVIQVRV